MFEILRLSIVAAAVFLFGYFWGAYNTLRAIEKARADRRGKEPHA